MKNIPSALQTHLDTGATTMAYCWRVTRSDSVIQGFTEHDRNLVFDGTTFLASSGFNASSIEQKLGLSVDNLNVDGALSDDTLNEDDLAAGVYDGAQVELFWVNWEDVTQVILISKGTLGEVKRYLSSFSAELRSLTNQLSQRTGRSYQRYCDADLGDSRCKIDLTSVTYKGTGTVSLFDDTRTLVATGLSSYVTDWFTLGKLTFTSGLNDGLSYEVKAHSKSGSNATIELWARPSFDISVTDTFEIFAGCKKDLGTCKDKFNNVVNFQGFPFIPGNDVITAYPIQGAPNQSGGSIFAQPGGLGT